MGVNGAAGLQRFHVVGKVVGVDHRRQEIRLGRAVVGGNRNQFAIVQIPEAGAVDLVDVAGAAGDEFGGFEQGVVGAVALTGQQQDQVLLGAYPVQVLELLLLGALVQFQGDLQA
ncbi:hypothetical protein D3C75_941350 [compost metagenome]